MMMNFRRTVFGASAAVLAAGIALADDGASLLRKVDEIRAPGASFQFTVQLMSDSSSQTMRVSVRDSTKGLVQYQKPARMKGRSILFVGKNMWIHVPGARRALRITPQQRILGSVSSADVARTVYSEDYRVVATTPVTYCGWHPGLLLRPMPGSI